MTRILVAIMAAIGVAAAPAAATSRQDYAISLEISSSGQSLATPSVQVRAGEIASVSSSDRYDVHFVATPDPDQPGHVLVSTNIVIPIEHGQRRLSWTVSVAEGEDARFDAPAQAGSAPLAIVLNARRLGE